jgi:hypothetical protein
MFELTLKQSGCWALKASATSAGSELPSRTSRTSRPFTHGSRIPSAWSPKRLGKERCYSHYELGAAKVEQTYSGPLSSQTV